MRKKITIISDTHGKHHEITDDLPGGDILIHCGDFMNGGWDVEESIDFLDWLEDIKGYKHKIFIAGNHDIMFENDPKLALALTSAYKNITYLQDSFIEVEGLKIYGSPWQPEFYNWAFNLPRGAALKAKWDLIPEDTDILVTHGPPMGFNDQVNGYGEPLGCYDLKQRVLDIKPKLHCFGHIHSGYGIVPEDSTKFINTSVLNESYEYTQKPITLKL